MREQKKKMPRSPVATMLKGNKSELRRKRRIDEVNQSSLIQIFPADPKQGSTLSGLNGRFLHSQIFMDVLLRVKGTQLDKEEFLSRCKNDLLDNEAALNILDEFQENYSSDQALWWYTRETFIYQLLNQALCSQNIDLLFYLRFFTYAFSSSIFNVNWNRMHLRYRCVSIVVSSCPMMSCKH